MNFHNDSVAATVWFSSLRCPARRLARSFRQSPTENRSRHPSQCRWRLGFMVGFTDTSALRSATGIAVWRWRTVAATANRQPPTANCQLPTANCQLLTANCQLPTANR
jgi:hypothetical protein